MSHLPPQILRPPVPSQLSNWTTAEALAAALVDAGLAEGSLSGGHGQGFEPLGELVLRVTAEARTYPRQLAPESWRLTEWTLPAPMRGRRDAVVSLWLTGEQDGEMVTVLVYGRRASRRRHRCSATRGLA